MSSMKNAMAALAGLALLLAACGGSSSVTVQDAWARESASVQNAAAVYLTISGGDVTDHPIGVSVDPSIATAAELHETAIVDADDDSGLLMMSPVADLEVVSDSEVRLEPGGYHIMMMGLVDPPAGGDEFQLVLEFANLGEVAVDVKVENR